MKAAFLVDKNTYITNETPAPVLVENEALIKVAACGFCGSDVHDAAKGSREKAPRTPGHEFAGVIEDIKGDTRGFKKGDAVIINPLVACGKCDFCKEGREHLCMSRAVIGCQPIYPGGFAQYTKVPTSALVAIPKGLTPGEATLADPLAVTIHALDLAGDVKGKSILIFGARTLGLFALQVAKLRGTSEIAVCDIIEGRLDLASKLGATSVFNAANDPECKAIADHAYDITIDLAGAPSTLDLCLLKAKRGGQVLVVAQRPPTEIRCNFLFGQEKTIKGVFGQTSKNFREALDLMASGKINGKVMLTDTFKLDQMQQAFDRIKAPESLKVLVCPN